MKFTIFSFQILIGLFTSIFAKEDTFLENLKSINSDKSKIEYSLGIDLKKNGKIDTLYLKNKLNPLLQEKETEICYYLLMADATSMLFDGVNKATNSYFDQAWTCAEKTKCNELKLITLIRQGYYYFTYREISSALPYFLSASNLLKETDLKQLPLTSRHIQFLANFFGYIDDPRKALEYYKLAQDHVTKNTRHAIDITNSIGLYYYKDRNFDMATRYYNGALKMAQQTKDSVWIGILNGNIGSLLLIQGDTTKAIKLAKSNVINSIKYHEYIDAMRTLLGLADIAVKQKNWEQAKTYIRQAEAYFEDKPFYVQYKTETYSLKAKIAQYENNHTESLLYLNKFIFYNDSLQKQKDAEKLQRTLWKWETDRYSQAISEAENKRKQARKLDITVAIIVILSLLLIILLINRSRQKIKFKSVHLEKKQLTLLLEKQKLDFELNKAKEDMKQFLTRIKESERIISALESRLSEAQSQRQDNVLEIQKNLNLMLESHIMTDDRWHKFKILFESSYPGFFEKQKVQYPNISENNLRLLTFTKLNLNNQSIAHLLGISLDGVKKAKQRLRKKLDLCAD